MTDDQPDRFVLEHSLSKSLVTIAYDLERGEIDFELSATGDLISIEVSEIPEVIQTLQSILTSIEKSSD